MKELNDCTIEEIKDLARMGQKFETMREEYNGMSEKLLSLSATLKEMATTINPLANIKGKNKIQFARGERKEIIEAIYDKMTHGMQITKVILEKMYSDKNQDWIKNVFFAIGHMPNVEKTKDGNKNRLFVK